MRDGVRLAADVFLPRGTGRWPTLLLRTPYSRKAPGVRSYRFFAQRGYAVLIRTCVAGTLRRACLGQHSSKGRMRTTQSTGFQSNLGRTAESRWRAAPMWEWSSGGQPFKTIRTYSRYRLRSPEMTSTSTGSIRRAERSRLDTGYYGSRKTSRPPTQVRPLFGSYIHHLPLRTADLAAIGSPLPLWRTALEHPSYDAYWKSCSIRERLNRIKVPVLSFGGWFDNYVESDLDAFSRLSSQRRPIETWVGPWAHNPGLKFPNRRLRTSGANWHTPEATRLVRSAGKKTPQSDRKQTSCAPRAHLCHGTERVAGRT